MNVLEDKSWKNVCIFKKNFSLQVFQKFKEFFFFMVGELYLNYL